VTITIGGNDLGFVGILQKCATSPTSCDTAKYRAELLLRITDLRPKLAATYADIRREAPNARVLVLGYPQLFPATRAEQSCGGLSPWKGEETMLREMTTRANTAIAEESEAAGFQFVDVASRFAGHEVCGNKGEWINGYSKTIRPVPFPFRDDESFHPNLRGQRAYADAVNATLAGSCTQGTDTSLIVDDSGSMADNDPAGIRAQALQLLMTKPTEQARTLGAVEFGGDAAELFAPGQVASNRDSMLASLEALQDDGIGPDDSGGTDYNSAFRESESVQPTADSRIFLTDGEHNVGEYEDLHRGGPPTYTVGLNIGPPGTSDEADLLSRIATETGGVYFPLQQNDGDDTDIQVARLQPVINSIDALLGCRNIQTQASQSFDYQGQVGGPVSGRFPGADALQVVASWTDASADFDLLSAEARNRHGRVIADLTGTKRIHGSHRHRTLLSVNQVEGTTFDTVTIEPTPRATSLRVRFQGVHLEQPTAVSLQIGPVPSGSSPGETVVTQPTDPTQPGPTPAPEPTPTPAPTTPPAPAPSTTYAEQASVHHPVHTFQNYHNASGQGPDIATSQWVQVSCKILDGTIASTNPDGYWYRIATSPWNNAYYAPANTFMNGDPPNGPYTHNTDFSVPDC
jgi:hypothetical protein